MRKRLRKKKIKQGPYAIWVMFDLVSKAKKRQGSKVDTKSFYDWYIK